MTIKLRFKKTLKSVVPSKMAPVLHFRFVIFFFKKTKSTTFV